VVRTWVVRVALTACVSVTGASAIGSAAAAQDELPDPCTLVSAADLEKRFGITEAGMTYESGSSRSCSFTAADGSSLLVRVDDIPTVGRTSASCSKTPGAVVKKVKKVGDLACTRTEDFAQDGTADPDSSYSSAIVFIAHENDIDLAIGFGGEGEAVNNANPKAIRKALIAVGKKAVKKL
jgi:hypothetical protein